MPPNHKRNNLLYKGTMSEEKKPVGRPPKAKPEEVKVVEPAVKKVRNLTYERVLAKTKSKLMAAKAIPGDWADPEE